MKKKLCLACIFLLIICSFPSASFAHGDRKDHFNDIELVLFGCEDGSYSKNLSRETKRKLRAIEYASILALDQYNGTDGTLLNLLKMLNIPDLPPNEETLYEQMDTMNN